MKALLLLGAGGLGSEALWVADEMRVWDCIGFADDDDTKSGIVHGKPLLGTIDAVCDSISPAWFHCAIGNNQARARIFQRFVAKGWQPATLIHPGVILAPDVTIGGGTYIGPGSVVCPHAVLGNSVLINCHVTVGHDSVMGDFSQACPGARINGNCKVGNFAFLGSNASLLPGITLGTNVTVGANSLVVRNVAEGSIVIGIPARKM